MGKFEEAEEVFFSVFVFRQKIAAGRLVVYFCTRHLCDWTPASQFTHNLHNIELINKFKFPHCGINTDLLLLPSKIQFFVATLSVQLDTVWFMNAEET